jgi:hypothetical protein
VAVTLNEAPVIEGNTTWVPVMLVFADAYG